MTHTESLFTLQLKATALQALIDNFTDNLRKVKETIEVMKQQPVKEAPQTIALEGPLTEEPEMWEDVLLKNGNGRAPILVAWRFSESQKAAFKCGSIYPATPGGAAGAMIGFNPAKP